MQRIGVTLGVKTVAEMVETAPIADMLTSMGVDYGQGYVFGKPEPFEDALQRLNANESMRLRKLWLES